jgi:hypothetical protein
MRSLFVQGSCRCVWWLAITMLVLGVVAVCGDRFSSC